MSESKYKPKYAKQLKNGMRANGKSIEECCVEWGVSRNLWYKWEKAHPKFREAVEMAETQYNAWFMTKYRQGMTGDVKMNAGMMVFAAKNVLGWAEKAETHVIHEEQVHRVQIERLPSYEERKALQTNIIDAEIINE